jgi:hypothetical protein
MAFVLGIDEAGYGPSLGPLLVGASLWQVPDGRADGCLWESLGGAVCRAGEPAGARLVVDDSKTVFDRSVGPGSLERSVLAFAASSGATCNTLTDLLEHFGSAAELLAGMPWYRELAQPLPLDRARGKFRTIADVLRDAMARQLAFCRGLRAAVVTETLFNRRVDATRNKAAVLIEQVLRHIAFAGDVAGASPLHIRVDRLGGRSDYRGLLATAFPDRHVHVLEVSEEISRYRLARGESDWWIEFSVDADKRHLPVALASMTAKYVREALMERFNAYWRRWLPELRPTAGYYTDAQRFLADIRPVLPRCGLDEASFVRRK